LLGSCEPRLLLVGLIISLFASGCLAFVTRPTLQPLQLHLLIVQHALFMVIERHEIEVHVLDAIILQYTLLLNQLTQIQIVQETRLRKREELVVVQG
jgi:hypothetical protein